MVCRLTTEADAEDDNVHRCGEDKEVQNVVLEDTLPWDHQADCKDHLIQAIKIGQVTPTLNERDIPTCSVTGLLSHCKQGEWVQYNAHCSAQRHMYMYIYAQ